VNQVFFMAPRFSEGAILPGFSWFEKRPAGQHDAQVDEQKRVRDRDRSPIATFAA
jgi:hypothetical protein